MRRYRFGRSRKPPVGKEHVIIELLVRAEFRYAGNLLCENALRLRYDIH